MSDDQEAVIKRLLEEISQLKEALARRDWIPVTSKIMPRPNQRVYVLNEFGNVFWLDYVPGELRWSAALSESNLSIKSWDWSREIVWESPSTITDGPNFSHVTDGLLGSHGAILYWFQIPPLPESVVEQIREFYERKKDKEQLWMKQHLQALQNG